jgi:hypothetical protein
VRVASQELPLMPSALPPTSPTTTPMVIGDRTASARTLPRRATPALASANSGTMT